MFKRAAFVGLVALLALGAPALAGTTVPITITVTVEYLSVAVNPTTVAFGTVAASSTTLGTKLDVTNDGNVAENIGLIITNQDDRGEWTAQAAAGANQYVLYGLVVNDGVVPTTGDCGADDDLTTSVQYWGGDGTAAGSLLTTNVATASPVAAGGQRDLYFGFTAPASVSGTFAGSQHTITVELRVYKD